MSITLVSVAAYVTEPDARKPGSGWEAFKFIRAIKGEPFRGYATIPVAGVTVRLNENTKHLVYSWFGQMAASLLRPRFSSPPAFVVPVPSSSAVVGAQWGEPAAPLRLAEELAGRLGSAVWDGLRWDAPGQAAHQGGSRDGIDLYKRLVLIRSMPHAARCLLVDDVLTGGGHMRAAVHKLREHGANVSHGVVAGRTTRGSQQNAFGVPDEVLHDLSSDLELAKLFGL